MIIDIVFGRTRCQLVIKVIPSSDKQDNLDVFFPGLYVLYICMLYHFCLNLHNMILSTSLLSYVFGYKTEIFTFQNNPKNKIRHIRRI